MSLVPNGEEGERIAASESFDVVILDMRLPGKSGLDVLQSLRARGFETPVLVLTAQDAVDAKVRTFRAGADDYVTKPFRLRGTPGARRGAVPATEGPGVARAQGRGPRGEPGHA